MSDINKTYAKAIASNIKLFRKIRGLTQEKLAEKADMSLSNLRNLENAVASNPGIINLIKVAKVLDIPIDFLLKDLGVRKFESYSAISMIEEIEKLPDNKHNDLVTLIYELYRMINSKDSEFLNKKD